MLMNSTIQHRKEQKQTDKTLSFLLLCLSYIFKQTPFKELSNLATSALRLRHLLFVFSFLKV